VRTLAFPSISTGAYRFPVDRAARIALHTVSEFLETSALPEQVTFVCFDETTLRATSARDVSFRTDCGDV